MSLDLCIVEQQADAPAGLLEDWARERGHRVVTLRAQELGAGPWPDPRRYGAIAPLGAEHSVHASPDPWIAPQVAFLREAHQAEIPVLGLCESALHVACMMGASFSLVTINEKFTPRIVENVMRYGLKDRLAAVNRMQISPDRSRCRLR